MSQVPQSKVFHLTRKMFLFYNCIRGVYALWALTLLLYDTWYSNLGRHHESSSMSIASTASSSSGASFATATSELHSPSTYGSNGHLTLTLSVIIIEATIITTGTIGALTLNVNYLRFYSVILTVSSLVFVIWSLASTFAPGQLGQEYYSEEKFNQMCFFITCLLIESTGIIMSCVLIHYISLASDHTLTPCDTIGESIFVFF